MSLAFLNAELQSLASETRRKHPEIREAAEKSLALLRGNPDWNASTIARDGPQPQEFLKAIFMGSSSRNAKVVAISMGSLQRLISIKAVPPSSIPEIVNIMGESVNQGVDIQLKVLQTLLSLLTNYTDVHDELLGDALLLCFRLQESRIAVVSSTAAATLRQLVMFVFDKVVDVDKTYDPGEVKNVEVTTTLPDGTSVGLHPSAKDAFSVFEDLCLLANSEKPHFLKLQTLPKTFALELIESVLTNYHVLFRKRPELLLLLRHHLCPLLLKALSDRPLFPLTLRSTRVVFLLLKQFYRELSTESEVFLMLLIKVISGETDAGDAGPRPNWMRVLALEILRGLCSDGELLRGIWNQYDGQKDSGSSVFTSLISALKRLATEKPQLLGVGAQMGGIGVTVQPTETAHATAASYGLEVAGRVASVATATVANAVGMMVPGAGLSVDAASMKLQCIDQLDKADSPIIPELYIYLLTLQCLISICDGFAAAVFPVYSTLAAQRRGSDGDRVANAPGALDLSTLTDDDPSTVQLRTTSSMVEAGWPGLLSALSFYISTNLSDDLFADALTSFANLTNVAGVLGLRTPRDAFLTSLAKFAIPPGVVSSVDSYVEPTAPRTASMSDALGFGALTGGPTPIPGLSERNIACLKSIVSTAMYLAGSLGTSWFDVLEVLQSADYVISLKGLRSSHVSKRTQQSNATPTATPRTSRIGSGVTSPLPMGSPHPNQANPRHPLFAELDPESVQLAVSRLFDATKTLDDEAFKDFVAALCKLSAEMVSMQSVASPDLATSETESDALSPHPASAVMTPSSSVMSPMLGPGGHKSSRRVSGMGTTKSTRSRDYGIAKLGDVAQLNIYRLIYRDPEIAWNAVTQHLLTVIRDMLAPPSIRFQAAEVLDDMLVIIPRNVNNPGPLQTEVQRRVFDVLSQQVFIDATQNNFPVVVDIRKLALETLQKILQSSGHSVVVGWETIFEILGSVCQPLASSTSIAESPLSEKNRMGLSIDTTRTPTLPTTSLQNTKNGAALVRIAFQSLTLVCDYLDNLSPEQLRLCITTIGKFGRQQDTNIALTAAESLLWGVSDSIQAKRKDAEKEPVYSELWTFLLLELQGLCTDSRHELRSGAIQTLFRTLQLYGATLSLETWDDCLWKVVLPLLDSLSVSVKETAALLAEEEPLSSVTVTPNAPTGIEKNPWDDSKTLALQSIGSVFHDFLISKICYLESFPNAWDAFVSHVTDSVLHDTRSISTAALRCLEKALKASANAGSDLQPIVTAAWERVWTACDVMGDALEKQDRNLEQDKMPTPTGTQPFTQETLQAFVDVIAITYTLSGKGWDLERLQRLLVILKGVMTYPSSKDYRPDIDTLSPVQGAVLNTIEHVELSVPGSPSLMLSDVAEYATLAFLAAFDYEEVPLPGSSTARPVKRVSYIALSKQTMPMLVQLYSKFKDEKDIYVDGTVERVFAAYSIPMKLKYETPAPSKFGSDPPLWKTASLNFLEIVKEVSRKLEELEEDVPASRVEGIWRQILDVYRGGLLADCSHADTMSLEQQEKEEDFDKALLTSLESDVVPRLGDPRVPDDLIVLLGKTLQIASRVHDLDLRRNSAPPSPPDTKKGKGSKSSGRGGAGNQTSDHPRSSSKTFKNGVNGDIGTTAVGELLPRERFSYWCFDLLVAFSSDAAKDDEARRRRIAALVLPSLLTRCHAVLANYVADSKLRSGIPFPRAQEDELLYVLRKMLEIKLWSGSLWAAFSQSPTEHASEQPAIDVNLRGGALIADAIRRSTKAHLYHFYGLLCEIATIPGQAPSVMVIDKNHKKSASVEEVKEIDARQLARQALKDIGAEMGVEI